MKDGKAKANLETSTLIFIKTHFTMIKCISIVLVFILTAALIWLLINRTPGQGTPDYSSSVCWNFKFSSTNKTYLPSDTITLSGSCDSANGTKAFCPFWNISSADTDFKVLHDNTIQDGQGCKRSVKIQAVDFKTTRKRIHLLVEIKYPNTEPLHEINIERSDDGEFCRQSRDCHFKDQFCSSGSCTCPEQWVFIRNIQKCVPTIFKVKEHCDFTAQCQIPKTTCRNGSCECNTYYQPDLTSTQCIPEEIYKVKGICLLTSQCKFSNSACHNGRCECVQHYTPNFDSTQCALEEIYKVKGHCMLTSQCKFSNSVCHNGRCECVQHYTPNFDSTQCVLEEIYKVKGLCMLTSQCKFSNSVCHKGRCECVPYYKPNFDSTQCVPEEIYKVNGPCLHTSQCKFSNSVCNNGRCECVQYYTANFGSTRCIPEGRDCGDYCLIDENCQVKNQDSECKWNRCDCNTDSRNDHRYDSRKDRYPNGAASSKAGLGWMILILVVYTFYTCP